MLECVGVKVERGVSGGKSLECVWESDEGEATCMSRCRIGVKVNCGRT